MCYLISEQITVPKIVTLFRNNKKGAMGTVVHCSAPSFCFEKGYFRNSYEVQKWTRRILSKSLPALEAVL